MIRPFVFVLDPTPVQVEAMRSHCGASRVAYNWCLARVRANWDQRRAEESYGVPAGERTPWIETSAYSLRKAWNAAKDGVAPWWRENSKEAYAGGCANLSAALKNRKDGRAGMPRFKSRHRSRPSCRFTTGSFGLVRDRRHVQLPVIGVVRTAESTRKLARKIEAGTARIRSVTLSFQRGRWQVSFSVEMPDHEPLTLAVGGRVVGVDLGIKALATLSTGEVVPNGRHLDRELKRLRRAQRKASRRRGPDRRTRRTPSRRWRKAIDEVARIHTRVANLRRNDTHRFTTRLVGEVDTIVVEDLHVAGMVRNRRLARCIADANWAEIRRQLTYKTEWAGKTVIVADRWFASSKTCSGCGTAKAKLALSERTYVCTVCGLVLDRDVNAAKNLAALASTGELRREKPDGTGVRRGRLAARAVGSPREGSIRTQRHHREVVATASVITTEH